MALIRGLCKLRWGHQGRSRQQVYLLIFACMCTVMLLFKQEIKDVGHYDMQDKVKSLTQEESWIILETDIHKARKLSSELTMTKVKLVTTPNPFQRNSSNRQASTEKNVTITNTTPRTASSTNPVYEPVLNTNSGENTLQSKHLVLNTTAPPSYPQRTSNPMADQRTTRFFIPNPRVDCQAMMSGDKAALQEAKYYTNINKHKKLTGFDYLSMANNCENFTKTRGYIMEPLSDEEAEFPIAFSILIHSSIELAERLLRSIYHPQNYYCIHVDAKTPSHISVAMKAIANCFPNVFIASQSEMVHWGHVSIIYAEMHCMKDLMQYEWKYFINLSGQMFPLHSNSELVKILKLYDGANDIEGTYKRAMHRKYKTRYQYKHHLDLTKRNINKMVPTQIRKQAPPHNAVVYKGSNQMAVTRAFVDYFLNNQTAKDILKYFSDTLAADEFIWPTLNHNAHLGAPGRYIGDPETKPFTTRLSVWQNGTHQLGWSWKNYQCQGKFVRYICMFGMGDLPFLKDRPELFANKFLEGYQYKGYDCLEEYIRNKTLAGSNLTFNSSYYDNLPFVKYKDTLVIR